MAAMMIDDRKRVAAAGARLQWHRTPIADIDLIARNSSPRWQGIDSCLASEFQNQATAHDEPGNRVEASAKRLLAPQAVWRDGKGLMSLPLVVARSESYRRTRGADFEQVLVSIASK